MTESLELLGPSQIRALAEQLDIKPTKRFGQNFVIDANTVRKIVRDAQVSEDESVLEIGPGLGSLTLGLLEAGAYVTAVEIDPVLSESLNETVRIRSESAAARLTIINSDAMALDYSTINPQPTNFVANLPYNVSVPVIIKVLTELDSIERGLVMVQAEVAERLAAEPGGRIYGVPSVKLQWFGEAKRVGSVGPKVFWPAPRVDSGLVSFTRTAPPVCNSTREQVFACIDAAFSQRRKTLRSALDNWAGSPSVAETILTNAGISSQFRGEVLRIEDFAAIADARQELVGT